MIVDWAKLDDLLADGFEDLLLAHWEEVATDRDVIPFAPDWERYRMMERNGMFRILAMRHNGRLIGYNGFFIAPNLHYSTSLQAINDVIYVDPTYRGAGVRLIREAEKRLMELGVQKIHYHVKIAVNIGRDGRPATVGDLLARMGYVHVEQMFAKLLRRSPSWPAPPLLHPSQLQGPLL